CWWLATVARGYSCRPRSWAAGLLQLGDIFVGDRPADAASQTAGFGDDCPDVDAIGQHHGSEALDRLAVDAAAMPRGSFLEAPMDEGWYVFQRQTRHATILAP